MERRNFIKQSCSACLAIGAGLMLNSLSSCTPLPIYKTIITGNSVTVPSTLLAINDLQIVRAKGYEYDIALRKAGEGTYDALLMQCTHADNQLQSTGNGFTCSLHGSAFDKEGSVTKGPAEHSLKKLKTEITEGNIIIYLS